MKKFLVLYKAPIAEMQEMMKVMTPEAGAKSMEEWKKWMDSHKDNFVDQGNPVGKTKAVAAGGAVSDTHNDIGGYSIVQAESHEAAAAIFQDATHLQMSPSATVEISEIMPM